MTADRARLPQPPSGAGAVEEAMRALVKALRTRQLYAAGNPVRTATQAAAATALEKAWRVADPLVLQVGRDALLFDEGVVLAESGRSAEGLAAQLFREGIREIRFASGLEERELEALLDILGRSRAAVADDDLVTLLWLADLQHFGFRHVEVLGYGDAPPGGERPQGADPQEVGAAWGGAGGPGGDRGPDSAAPAGGAGAPPPRASLPASVDEEVPGFLGAVRPTPDGGLDDVPLLLEPEERAYLDQWIAYEAGEAYRMNVLSALLDIVALDIDAASQLEAVNAIDALLVELLGLGQYGGAAAVLEGVEEVTALPMEMGVREALGRLARRLEAPDVLEGVLRTLGDPRGGLAGGAGQRLLAALGPDALPALAGWLGAAPPSAGRVDVERVAATLADRHPDLLASLLDSTDFTVLVGALALAERRPSGALVPALCRAARHGDAGVRAQALGIVAGLDGPGVASTVARGCVDPERVVRMAAYRAVTVRRSDAARAPLLEIVSRRGFADLDVGESMALFEALGSVADDATVDLLDRLLNASGFMGPKETAEVRACAARALGRAGTAAAHRALVRARDARDPLVQRTVRRALDVEGVA